MAGIHVHPHDIVDEGSTTILDLIRKMGDVQYIFPQVNTIFERNPYPSGVLPHNSVREHVTGEGTLHVHLNLGDNSKLYQKVDASIGQGADPLQDIIQAAKGSSYRIIPWINVLNGDFQDPANNNNVIDYQGRPVDHWLCPNGPDVVPMWISYILKIAERYGSETFLIDRIRFPDWAGKEVSPRNLFSCFCPHCLAGMEQAGIDVDRLKSLMSGAGKLLSDQHYDQAVEQLKESRAFHAFLSFRQNSVSAMVENLVAALRQSNPAVELWIDLWPPSYAWLLGQDYSRLTKASSTLKHFPYHKLGGGADVQGLINYFAPTQEQREEAFRAFLKFFDMEYSLSYEQFCEKGFPIVFVQQENQKVRAQSQPETFIYSGVQMWNLTSDELVEAIEAARDSEADDLLYYCYGWADLDLMRTVGRLSGK